MAESIKNYCAVHQFQTPHNKPSAVNAHCMCNGRKHFCIFRYYTQFTYFLFPHSPAPWTFFYPSFFSEFSTDHTQKPVISHAQNQN